MDQALSALAAIGATGFTIDLGRSYRARPRPHVAAYGLGMAFFAGATWALFAGTVWGWSEQLFRVFFLFGGIVNIPLLALGSVFLAIGSRAGRVAAVGTAVFCVVATLVTLNAQLVADLPETGIPQGSELFAWPGPRLWAAFGGGAGASVLLVLAVVSIFRFWKTNLNLVAANGFIVAGVLAASTGGTLLAFGESAGFALALLLAAWFIWLGHRVAIGTGRVPSIIKGGPGG